MRRIFCIIAAIIMGFVGSFLIVLGLVRVESGVAFDEPYSINIYYKGTTTINKGESYYSTDPDYSKIIKAVKKTTTNSLLSIMYHNNTIGSKIKYGSDKYSSYDTSMKNNNLVVELIYRETKNVVCYEEGNSRVISYTCIIMIIPIESKFGEIVVYSSVNNDSTLKEEEYKKSTPFIMYGNPKNILKFVGTLAK